MIEFIYIISFAGIILYFLTLLIFICMNRNNFSANLPSQIKMSRWFFSIELALPTAGWFTLIVDHYLRLSEPMYVVVLIVLYLAWFALWFAFAKHSIKEWFVPFAKLPQLPILFFPKNKGHIIALIIFIILMAAFLFGPF